MDVRCPPLSGLPPYLADKLLYEDTWGDGYLSGRFIPTHGQIDGQADLRCRRTYYYAYAGMYVYPCGGGAGKKKKRGKTKTRKEKTTKYIDRSSGKQQKKKEKTKKNC